MRARKNDDERRTVRVLLGLRKSFPPYPTPLVAKCEAALETPMGDLSLEQLRLLISQRLGLDQLISKALDTLEQDPAISVTFCEGDLLKACLSAPPEFWNGRANQATRLADIAARFSEDGTGVVEARVAFMKSLEEAT